MCPLYLTDLLPIMKSSCYSLRLNRAPTVPNFRNERLKSTFFLPALPIGTNLIPIYKILLQLKFLNEHYMYTGFTIHED